MPFMMWTFLCVQWNQNPRWKTHVMHGRPPLLPRADRSYGKGHCHGIQNKDVTQVKEIKMKSFRVFCARLLCVRMFCTRVLSVTVWCVRIKERDVYTCLKFQSVWIKWTVVMELILEPTTGVCCSSNAQIIHPPSHACTHNMLVSNFITSIKMVSQGKNTVEILQQK